MENVLCSPNWWANGYLRADQSYGGFATDRTVPPPCLKGEASVSNYVKDLPEHQKSTAKKAAPARCIGAEQITDHTAGKRLRACRKQARG